MYFDHSLMFISLYIVDVNDRQQQSTAARPSWTRAHVDHRPISPNCHVPDLSHYIRDKVGPHGRGRTNLGHSIRFRPLLLSTESRATHREGASRAPPPHPVVFLLSNVGKTPPVGLCRWVCKLCACTGPLVPRGLLHAHGIHLVLSHHGFSVSPSCRMHVHQFSSVALPSWLPCLSDQPSQIVEPNC
jgi:hypothetical protein